MRGMKGVVCLDGMRDGVMEMGLGVMGLARGLNGFIRLGDGVMLVFRGGVVI